MPYVNQINLIIQLLQYYSSSISYKNSNYTPSFVALFVFLTLDAIYTLCPSYRPMPEGNQAMTEVGYLCKTVFFLIY